MRKILFSAFFLFTPLLLSAQHAAAPMGAARAPMMAAPHAAPAAAPRAVAVHATAARPAAGRAPASRMRPIGTHPGMHPGAPVSGAHRVSSPTNPVFTNPRPGDTFPVPGLGFDYPHFFATHPNFGKTHRTNGFLLPFLGGGIYVPYPYYAEPPTAEEETADYNSDPAPPAAEAAASEPAQPASTVRSSTYTPLQPQSEFVFVRRDGTVFFAIAYAWSADKLQYVTKDGQRRTVTKDVIDLDATQQFNEQRGVSIRLPA